MLTKYEITWGTDYANKSLAEPLSSEAFPFFVKRLLKIAKFGSSKLSPLPLCQKTHLGITFDK